MPFASRCPSLLLFVLAAVSQAQQPTAAPDLSGTWFTTRGVVELKLTGEAVEGRYGDERDRSFAGKRHGDAIEYTATEGQAELAGTLKLDPSGHRLAGDWRAARGNGEWRWWRHDPATERGELAEVAGYWRTSWGMLELQQKGGELSGGIGAQGWYTVTGKVVGRHITLHYASPFGAGDWWLDVDADGKAAWGGATNERGQWSLQAQRVAGAGREADPVAGKIVSGIAANRLVYHVHAPEGWQPGTALPLLVILHGSNYASRPYVEGIAASDFGARYLVLGIDGERWNEGSAADDPRQNYTYVNFMGRSTYEGYPNTDRESPALVAELLRAVQQRWHCPKTFVGGHSQGGFLTWFFAMHYPELVAGVFPISCGLVMQCEPDVFADATLRALQRKVAIAVVHGRRDPNVPFAQGEAAWQSCVEAGFPRLRLFANGAGHGFSSLAWQEAVTWLETVTGDDVEALAKLGDEALDDDRARDATAALASLRELSSAAAKRAVAALAPKIDAAARDGVARFAPLLDAPGDGAWIDDFLAFRDGFEFADAARDVMARFTALRAVQTEPATKLFGEARGLFQKGQRDEGWAKYEELVAKCWASPLYRRVRGWLDDR